jgi:predicted Na+-dependent transporter
MGVPSKDVLLDVGLPLMVVLLMAGMGATIVPYQVRMALKKPWALICGMTSQFVLMPLIGYALYKLLNLSEAHAVGLIVVCACPGGTTSNLFAFWSKGDVALSICMTVCSSLAALFMMPLLIELLTGSQMDIINAERSVDCLQQVMKNDTYALRGINQYCWDTEMGTASEDACQRSWEQCQNGTEFMSSYNSVEDCLTRTLCYNTLGVDSKSIITFLAAQIVPVALGMWARSCTQRKWLADTIQSIGNNAGIIVIVVVVITGSINYTWVFTESPWQVWVAALLVGNLGFFFGYQLARLGGLSVRHCRTVSLETGIQNGPVAITMAQLAFPHCTSQQFGTSACLQSQVLTFPLLYSIFIVLQSVGVSVFVYQRYRPEPPPTIPPKQSRAVRELKDGSLEGVEDGDAADAGALPRRSYELALSQPLVETIKLEEIAGYGKQSKDGHKKSKTAVVVLPMATKGATNLWQNFLNAATTFPKRKCLGTREPRRRKRDGKFVLGGPYKWETYEQVHGEALKGN